MVKTVTRTVEQFTPKLEIVRVERPHNCEPPEPTTPDAIRTADKAIAYLNAEYRVKYLACLDSLAVSP